MPKSIHHSTIRLPAGHLYGCHIFQEPRKRVYVPINSYNDFDRHCKDWPYKITAKNGAVECTDSIQLKDFKIARDMYCDAALGINLTPFIETRLETLKALIEWFKRQSECLPRSQNIIRFKHFNVEDFIMKEFMRNRIFLMNVKFLTAIYQKFIKGHFCHFCKLYNKNWPIRYNVCGDCRVAYYCSTRCQESHYKSSHKKVCSKYYKL